MTRRAPSERRRTIASAITHAITPATATAIALASFGCGEEPPVPAEPGRVLLIGIDGASPIVTDSLMAEGSLPNLRALADGGVYGALRSVLPLYSPRIWNTIATGKTAEEHGVMAFVKLDEEEKKHLYLSQDRVVPALWNILSAAGLKVGVINWWTTYPPEKIDGVMVSDHFFPEQIAMIRKTFRDAGDSDENLMHPPGWLDAARYALEEAPPLTESADPFASDLLLPRWINRALLSRQFKTDNEVARVALAAQRDFEPDVMMVFLPGIDRVSHWLWGNLESPDLYPPGLQTTEEARAGGREALFRYYEYTDALIGALMQDYGPDDLVLVISDHGFEAGVSMMYLTGEHDSPGALDGVIYARGRGIQAGIEASGVTVYDVAPSVLAWLGLPVADDMEGGAADFLPASYRPPKVPTVASYDDVPVERTTSDASGREGQIVEHLRGLGYLETVDEETEGQPGQSERSERRVNRESEPPAPSP